MNNYSYVIENHPECGYVILLKQISTGNQVMFRSAGGILKMLEEHMNSLTDACCNDYFKKGRK